MGLDMYLERETYVKNWDHLPPEEKYSITVKRGGKKDASIDPKRIKEITEEVMYWRKANAIHNWFVQNCQGGVDECQRTEVSKDALQQLVDACKTALADREHAADILPPTSGFFFGSTNVDEWYWQDLQETVKVLEEELQRPDDSRFGASYYYQSSW